MSSHDAHPSTEFLRELSAFAISLSESGVSIYAAHFDFGTFGSWELQFGSRETRYRLFYDGRDNYLSLSRSQVRQWSAPNDWRDVAAVGCGESRYRSSIPLAQELMRKYSVA